MTSTSVLQDLGGGRTDQTGTSAPADLRSDWAPEVSEPETATQTPSGLKGRVLDAFGRFTRKRREARIEQLRAARGAVYEKLHEVPERMQKLVNQMRLLLDLVEDYWEGRYRRVPWYSLGVSVLAMLYFLSPSDVVPDWLPLVGQLDDVAAVAIALRLLRNDLRKYCEFRGLNPADYF